LPENKCCAAKVFPSSTAYKLAREPSGTEPVIRVMGEGDDKILVEQAVDEALTPVAA
jgi:hypothetical protein